MKQILTFSLVFFYLIVQSQEEYLLKKFYRMNWEDTSYMYKFEYNDDFTLNNYKIFYGSIYDEFIFENDTLVASEEFDRSYTYEFYQDSVLQIEWASGQPDTVMYHYLDQQHRLVHTWAPDGFIDHFYNEWEGENVIKHSYHMMDILHFFTIDYSGYLNPLYPAFKSLRLSPRGSYNYPETQYDESGNPSYTYDVVESLGGYPTVVNGWDGNINHQLRYEYLVVTDVDELENQNFEPQINSVKYFDLMGREIPKPAKGFYIECKFTGSGVKSKKYFLP